MVFESGGVGALGWLQGFYYFCKRWIGGFNSVSGKRKCRGCLRSSNGHFTPIPWSLAGDPPIGNS
jgi:hypothetical protein